MAISRVMKNQTNSKNTHVIEHEGVNILLRILGDKFDVKRTREGCLADMAIRSNEINDKWIMIQLKVTSKSNNSQFTFGLKNNKYVDCLIFCVCVDPEEIWLIPGKDVQHLTKIAISSNKYSKYDKYHVGCGDIIVKMCEYYQQLPQYTFDHINTPLTSNCRLEKDYAAKRMNYIQGLTFEEPCVQNQSYDFVIKEYGLTVQEKVSNVKRNGITFSIHKRRGRHNHQPYKIGDAQVYWLHFRNDDRFLVIPEHVMVDMGYVSDIDIGIIGKRCIYLSMIDSKWKQHFGAYLFNYTNLDMSALKHVLMNAKKSI
jgi:predicted nucleic acid-binding Zn finger protein